MLHNLLVSAKVLAVNMVNFDASSADGTDRRVVTDYEIDFHIKGKRSITINNETFNINGGDIIFRKPGDFATSTGHYNTYCLTLDFSNTPDRENYYDRNISRPLQKPSDLPLLNIFPPHFISYHTQDYINIYNKLILLKTNRDKHSTDTLVNELLCLAMSDYFHNQNKPSVRENDLIEDVCKYISENYDKSLNLNQLAARCNLSESYFLKTFKEKTSTSPINYLISIRIQNAKEMLSETNYKINYISNKCGFSSTSYFSHTFKQQTGMSPAEYRNLTQHI